MRTPLVPLSISLLVAAASGCATLSGSGGTAKFQGKAAVAARVKELQDKLNVADACTTVDKENFAVGIIEVTAKADGKVVARAADWKSTPAISACIVDAAQKIVLGPLPGPAVSHIWWFAAPGTQHPTPPNTSKGDMVGMSGRIQPEVEACAQRHLPNDFGADIEVAFYILPGGKVLAPTVTRSSASDGDYDTCVQNVIGSKTMPESGFDGPFPALLRFHVGPLEKM